MFVHKLEVEVLVEMLLPVHAALDQLVRKLSLQLHEQPEHVVVGLPREEDLSREELKHGGAHGKRVGWRPILGAKADLWGTIEAAHQVRRWLDLRELHGAAQVTDLDKVVTCCDEDVVRFDVGVEDAAPVDVPKADQQLLGVGTDGPQRHTFVLCVLLQCYPQVVPHALKHEAQVPPVAEGPQQPDDILLVALVRPVDPLQELHLLLRSLAHHVVAAHDLDGHERLVLLVPGLDDVGEDALAAHVLHDEVPPVHLLADARPVVPLLVVPVVRRGSGLADGRGLVHCALQAVLVLPLLLEHIAIMLRLERQDEAVDRLFVFQRLLVLGVVALKLLPPFLEVLGHLPVGLGHLARIHGRVGVWAEKPAALLPLAAVHPLRDQGLAAGATLRQLPRYLLVGLSGREHGGRKVGVAVGPLIGRLHLVAPGASAPIGVLHPAFAILVAVLVAVLVALLVPLPVTAVLLTAVLPATVLLATVLLAAVLLASVLLAVLLRLSSRLVAAAAPA
mmetsp:Transcript_14116/g.44036  ORF Transcript_14116/g.44036 Transcript_14116/m.44036 type:complete len:505 (+) Transcript_14116:901-2415(+)